MNCCNCGNELSVGAKFCPVCGNEASAFCYKCGTPLSAGAQFCKSCGTKINIPGMNVSGKRKPKKERVSKIYSFIMLGIAALVAMFTPAVQLSGEYYNVQYNTDVYKDAGDIALLVRRTWGSGILDREQTILIILAVVCVALLLASVGLHFVNRLLPPFILAGVFGVLLIVSDIVAVNFAFAKTSVAHLGIGFFVHLLCIGLLIASFFLNHYRTQERQKVPVGHYKMSRLETHAIVTFSCFFLFALIVTIACYAEYDSVERFVDTPVPKYQNDREMVEEEAKQLCEIHDVDLTGYDLYDIENDGNGRYIVVFTSESKTEVYAVYIDSPDYYTGRYLQYSEEPVRMAYGTYYAVEKATPSAWGEDNELYKEILDSHYRLQKGEAVPDIDYPIL